MCGFAFAQSELGFLYFKYEVIDSPWTGYAPPNADNLAHIVCLDITFISNLPKEYTDYFVDVFENTENNTGVTNPFGAGRKAFAIFARTGNGFISRRPFAKKWDDTMLVGPGNYGQGYTEAEMRNMITGYVQFVLNTGGKPEEKLSAKVAGDNSVQDFWDATWEGEGFRFQRTNRFERKWVVYKD
jgi:hypothetical protein